MCGAKRWTSSTARSGCVSSMNTSRVINLYKYFIIALIIWYDPFIRLILISPSSHQQPYTAGRRQEGSGVVLVQPARQ